MPAEDLEPKLIIEKLTQAHSLAEFECSNATLDTWLKRYAWTNQKAETSKTYVAQRGGRVLGYHALVAGSVLKHEAPERIVQGIANHPVGVILLARLAVDKSEHGKGFGKALLRDALARIRQAADHAGALTTRRRGKLAANHFRSASAVLASKDAR